MRSNVKSRLALGLGSAFAMLAIWPAGASAMIVFQDSAGPGTEVYRVHESTCGGATPCPEKNDLNVLVEGSNYIVSDNGPALQAGDGCTQLSDRSASCPIAWSDDWDVDLGGRDDQVHFYPEGSTVALDAGPGEDTLLAQAASESFSGGPGTDFLSYFSSPPVTGTTGQGPGTGVTVNLATGVGSGAGTYAEGDSYSSIEDVSGTFSYGDTLRGAGGPNDLDGIAGADRLLGGGGSDRLDGGAHRDRLYGNGGADWLSGTSGHDRLFSAGDGTEDVNDCGGGQQDRAYRDPTLDSADSCEILPLG